MSSFTTVCNADILFAIAHWRRQTVFRTLFWSDESCAIGLHQLPGFVCVGRVQAGAVTGYGVHTEEPVTLAASAD
jgi:hypothetical protein